MRSRSSLEVDFLELPIKSRNRVTLLFSEIKSELKKGYALKELNLNAHFWDDVSLSEFIILPKRH